MNCLPDLALAIVIGHRACNCAIIGHVIVKQKRRAIEKMNEKRKRGTFADESCIYYENNA